MLLVIKLAELSQGSQRHWKHFTVRGYYTPVTDKLSAHLERDGTIELIGERLNFRDQIALRGIFTKVMSKNRALPVVSEKVAHDPRLRTMGIGYFYDVITNGFGVMPDYRTQLSARDRWAVVAYIRALQLSQHATTADVPGGDPTALKPPAPAEPGPARH